MGNKPLFISITGTMGSGKTTAARLLAKKLKLELVEENFGDNAFLPRFYKDMKRWAFHSQTFFLMEKITQMLNIDSMLNSSSGKLKKPKQIIQDTPLYQDVFSYAKAQHITGNIDDAEWRLYRKIYRSFVPYLPKPDVIIYLKTSLPEVKKRIFKRKRDFETKIPDGYLEILEMLNEKWLRTQTDGIKIIEIGSEKLNIVRSKKDKEKLVSIIRKALNL